MEIRVFSTFYCVRFFFPLGIGRNANFWSFALTQTLGTAGEPQVTGHGAGSGRGTGKNAFLQTYPVSFKRCKEKTQTSSAQSERAWRPNFLGAAVSSARPGTLCFRKR